MLILEKKARTSLNLACNLRITKNSKINSKEQKEGNNEHKTEIHYLENIQEKALAKPKVISLKILTVKLLAKKKIK